MFVNTLGACPDYNPCGPKEFLNAGCRDYKIISQGGYVNDRVRRRQHHRDCPIIISFLNGKNEYFTNDIYSIVVKGADTWSDPYTYSAECVNRTLSPLPTTIEPVDSKFRLLNFYLPYNITSGGTVNAIPADWSSISNPLIVSIIQHTFYFLTVVECGTLIPLVKSHQRLMVWIEKNTDRKVV